MLLTKEDIDKALDNNPYESTIRRSISNYFEDLNEPVAVAISISPPAIDMYGNIKKEDGYYKRDIFYKNTDKIVDILRENGIDAVSFMDKEAANPAKFVVNGNGVVCPFMKPEDALKATVMIETIVRDNDFQLTGHANPISVKNMLYSSNMKPQRREEDNVIDVKSSHPNPDKFAELESKYGNYNNFIEKKVNEAYVNSEVVDFNVLDEKNVYGGGEFLYRGGSLGANPYAVISEFNSRKIAHSSPALSICSHFSGKGHSHSSKGGAIYAPTNAGVEYGFIYKLRSMGDEQKYYQNIGLETAANPKSINESNRSWNVWKGDVYESPVVPHHNKLEAIYVHVGKNGENKLFEIPIDENGNIKDEEWRDFMEMHEPTDDKVTGYMAQRQDLQKQEQTINPNHSYNFELKNNLQKDSQEYLKDISAKNFIECFTHKSNIEEITDGFLKVDDSLNLPGLKMQYFPNLSKLSINHAFINYANEIKITSLPESNYGIQIVGGGKIVETNSISTEKFVKIIGAEKNDQGWYYQPKEISGGSYMDFDGIPQGWEEAKFDKLPSFCNFEYDSIEQIPETRHGIGMSGVKIKNQNSIEDMPIDKFLYKINGNVGTRPGRPALNTEEFTPIEKSSNLIVDLGKTNITNFPKGFDEYKIKSIIMPSKEKVSSLDNFPITKEGTYSLSFDGDLKNETMLSFLQKTKGTDWVQANTTIGNNGHLIINGDLDFRAKSYDSEPTSFSLTSLPKDFDNVEIKGKIAPNNVNTFVHNHKQIRSDIMRGSDDLIIPIENQKDFTLSELKCSILKIEGNGKITEKLPESLEHFVISRNNYLDELPKLPNSCTQLNIVDSNIKASIDIPNHVSSIDINKSTMEQMPIINHNLETFKLYKTEFKNGTNLDLSKCQKVELSNIKIPNGATLDLSACQKLTISDMDLSKCNVIMPKNAKYISMDNIKLPDNYKMDLSSCKSGNIENVQCAEIKLPKTCSEESIKIPHNVKEVTTEFLNSARKIEEIPENIKIIDSIDEKGNKISLKTLKRKGVPDKAIKTLRNQRMKEQLLAPINKLKNLFQKNNNTSVGTPLDNQVATKISQLRGVNNNTQTKTIQEITKETLTDTLQKDAVKASASMGKVVDNVVSGISKVDNAVNQTIDTVIDKGSDALNNTSVGKAYEKATNAISNTKVVKAVEKTTAEVGEKVAKSAVGKAVTKTVAKTAGSAVGKSILKKIPILSLGAGLYFAYDRIKDGDWKGACGEVASGALGCLPGLGTAASTAIDVGLAAKDISAAVNETKTTSEEKTTKETPNKNDIKNIIMQKRGLAETKAQTRVQSSPQQVNLQIQQRLSERGRG